MANWSTEVVSHEKEEDTNPQYWLSMAQNCERNGNVTLAEGCYIKAWEYSGKQETYYESVIRFLYRTNPSRADNLFWNYYKKTHPQRYALWKMYSHMRVFIAALVGFAVFSYYDKDGTILRHLFAALLFVPCITITLNQIVESPNKQIKKEAGLFGKSLRNKMRTTANKTFGEIFIVLMSWAVTFIVAYFLWRAGIVK